VAPDVVVDVGNTRIKWGRCSTDAVRETVSLSPDDAAAWQRQVEAWDLPRPASWVVTGVHPARRNRLADWLRQRGDQIAVLTEWRNLPLVVKVPRPETVGIDRLLDAVAANALRKPGCPAVVIDAGSAITVDWIDESGAFGGGAILPGFGLMAKALHDYTALLPLVETPQEPLELPATATPAAIAGGIFNAVVGGVCAILAAFPCPLPLAPSVFLTGGDAAVLATVLIKASVQPLLTLEGIRLTALHGL